MLKKFKQLSNNTKFYIGIALLIIGGLTNYFTEGKSEILSVGVAGIVLLTGGFLVGIYMPIKKRKENG